MSYTSTCTYLGPEFDPRKHDYSLSSTPYCGCKVVEGTSYCEEHYPIVYQVGSGLRKRHKDIRRAEAVHTMESLFHEVVAELELEGVDFD